MMKLLSTALLLLFPGLLSAQLPDDRVAFNDGEELTYMVSYRAKLVPNTEVARVVFRTTRENVGAVPTYRIYANARCLKFFNWFFALDDTYNTWLSVNTLRPVQFSSNLSEGDYRFNSFFSYNWGLMEVNTRYRNPKRHAEEQRKTLALTRDSYDGVALFYNLRARDVSEFTEGEPMTLNLLMEDTIRQVTYRYLGREEKQVKGLGKVKTLKFSLLLVTSSGESFDDGTELFLWISDDRNKIPVLVETPIKVGSVRVRLAKYKNLKYETDSFSK